MRASVSVKPGMEMIQFQMSVPVSFKKERGYWIASCTLLDVHSQGSTKQESQENVIEALQLFMECCYEDGTLDEVLKSCGFKPARERKMADKKKGVVKVPLSLVARSHGEATACPG